MESERPWYMVTRNNRFFSTFYADDDADAAREIQRIQAASSDPTETFALGDKELLMQCVTEAWKRRDDWVHALTQ